VTTPPPATHHPPPATHHPPPATHHPPPARYYQLTHDYLVHSLRDWLTRKQRETRRGRAELRLAERASLWNARPENRHLPSVPEWATIRTLTGRKDWTEPERRMMTRAGRVHGLRGLGLAALLALGTWGGIEAYGNLRSRALVESLQTASTADVPTIIKQLAGYRGWAKPRLVRLLGESAKSSREHLHASLALLPEDTAQVDGLYDRLIAATAAELPVLRESLRPHRAELAPKLWSELEKVKPGDSSPLLSAAGALALYDPESPRWADHGGKVARALVTVNPVFLGQWLDALRPVRGRLTTPLAAIFRDKARPETEHTLATNILADYAADDPAALAELLMVAEPKSYRTLFPVAERQADRALPVLQAELARTATFQWNDPSPDPAWTKPDPALGARIEAAVGLFAERFAVCQAMPLDDFLTTAEALRPSGYRPVRFRPYADGSVTLVAAVWTRDARGWRIASGLSPEDVRRQDEANRKQKLLPADIAGYVAASPDARPAIRYAALWAEKVGDDDAQLYIAATEDVLSDIQKPLDDAKLIPRTLHAVRGTDGRLCYSGVWGKPPGAGVTAHGDRNLFEKGFADSRALRGDEVVIDVAASEAAAAQSIPERARAALARAEKSLKAKPDDADARKTRALANLRLGENAKALEDSGALIAKEKDDTDALAYHAIALARLGKKENARADLAKLEKTDPPDRTRLFLALVVAAELGEGADKAIGDLDAALKRQADDFDLPYAAARAFALASPAVARKDKAKGQAMAARAIALLQAAVKDGDADFGRMEDDFALDPVRDDRAFTALMKAGHPDRRFAAVWSTEATIEAGTLDGLDPDEAIRRARDLVAQGFRPAAWSAARTTADSELLTASVWHRPVVTDDVKDRLAERQARAAVAMVRLGKAETVWPLLRHSADPRLRSFILNWLNPLGADPKLIASELDLQNSPATPGTRRVAPPATRKMDAILFHPGTSIRRALILALGTFGTEGLSPGEREPLMARLFDLYRSDPDAGIHGAAEWTLRKLGQHEKLKTVDLELSRVKERGNRRWFVNGEGQTFAVIEGPVEFRMGSPATETERFAASEPLRRMVIPRRFAVATKEVTVAQFQRFLKVGGITNDRYQVDAGTLNKFSPDSDGPWIGPDWYTAAHYCNWLSEQEGLPRDQWCYIPAEGGAYAEGMTIPADVLRRSGYRLPTEAEWEYACRAGATTARYHGLSLDLLGAYARYQANSSEHAWSCGDLLPNDLGLFDMLGNVFEWTLDEVRAEKQSRKTIYYDIINIIGYINDKSLRILRGGAFNYRPAVVRSALRTGDAPAYRYNGSGFRPSRTYP